MTNVCSLHFRENEIKNGLGGRKMRVDVHHSSFEICMAHFTAKETTAVCKIFTEEEQASSGRIIHGKQRHNIPSGRYSFSHCDSWLCNRIMQPKRLCLIGGQRGGSCDFQPSFRGGSLCFLPNGRGGSCVPTHHILKCSGPPPPYSHLPSSKAVFDFALTKMQWANV